MERTEIRGRRNTAVCFARVIEQEAIEQIRRMCDYPVTDGCQIRIMPDVHAGKGCTVGTTMTIVDQAIPNVVGVDIGCGMYTVALGKGEIDLARLDEAAHALPSGRQVWDRVQEDFDLSGLLCFGKLRDVERLKRSLGTLGGGNHFIEVDEGQGGEKYLVIHSGSRNLGVQVAGYYQDLAIRRARGEEESEERRAALIRELKAQGRAKEIQAALRDFGRQERERRAREPQIPEDLCALSGQDLEDYLHDVEICQRFARRNRELMAGFLLAHCALQAGESFHTVHNYIDTQERILRKGAIAAHLGERVLIPISMRDGAILAVGRGNPDWNFSAPHGAGRVMSRREAREKLSLSEYRESMAGIYTTCVSEQTIDEAPMAYKSLDDIAPVVRESVDIQEVLRPVYNFKASE